MKYFETVKEYGSRFLRMVNNIRLMGEELSEKRVVEKVLVSLPERISSLEDSRDLNQTILSELVNPCKHKNRGDWSIR